MRSVPLVSILVRASPRKRMWLAGGGLAVFLLTFVVGNGFVRSDRAVTRADLGHDFLAFYTAAAFVRDGRYRQLYDLEAVRHAEAATARAAGIDLGSAFGPWWNPPFYALALEPLAGLPYGVALDVWRWINVASLVAAAVLLGRMARRPPFSDGPEGRALAREKARPSGPSRNGMLALLLLVTSMPFVQAIGHAQNTCTSLLLLSATVTLWRAERAVWAGVVGGLLFYKPQLGAVVAGVMAVDLGWGAVGGLAITGVAVAAVTAVALPGSLADWVHRLPANVRFMQVEHAYLWDRHVTIKSFWRLLLQGTAAGEARPLTTVLTDVTVAAVAGPLAWVTVRAGWGSRISAKGREGTRSSGESRCEDMVRQTSPNFAKLDQRVRAKHAVAVAPSSSRPFASLRGQSSAGADGSISVTGRSSGASVRRDRLIAATVCAMPLLMPFYFDYDLLLLAVPLALYAADPRRQRSLSVAWVVLYGWLFVNAPVASRLHVGGAAVVLAGVTALSIRRVGAGEAESMALFRMEPLAAAA